MNHWFPLIMPYWGLVSWGGGIGSVPLNCHDTNWDDPASIHTPEIKHKIPKNAIFEGTCLFQTIILGIQPLAFWGVPTVNHIFGKPTTYVINTDRSPGRNAKSYLQIYQIMQLNANL